MPKYLGIIQIQPGEGIATLLEDGGSKRHANLDTYCQTFGMKVDAYHLTADGQSYGIYDAPDLETATSAIMNNMATGHYKAQLIPLLSPEQFDVVSQKLKERKQP